MAYSQLALTSPTMAGTTWTPTPATLTDGNSFANDGHRALWVNNASGGVLTITFDTPGTVDSDLAVPQRTVTVANGAAELIGKFDPAVYNQRSGVDSGKVLVTWSTVTSVTVVLLPVA